MRCPPRKSDIVVTDVTREGQHSPIVDRPLLVAVLEAQTAVRPPEQAPRNRSHRRAVARFVSLTRLHQCATTSLSRGQLGQQFEAIRAGNGPSAHFVQLYWLLMSFFSACACIEVNASGIRCWGNDNGFNQRWLRVSGIFIPWLEVAGEPENV